MTDTNDLPESAAAQTPIGVGSNNGSKKPCRYRLTWEQTIQDYKDGLITHRGLVYYSVVTRSNRLIIPKIGDYCKDLNIRPLQE